MIQGHTPTEIQRYRALKLLLAIAMVPLSYHGFTQGVHQKSASLLPLQKQDMVVHDEAMRSDFPLRWARDGQGQVRPLGTNYIHGKGPVRSDAILYDGDSEVSRGRTGEDGRWIVDAKIVQPGLHTYHVEFRRNGIGMGRTRRLPATVLDPKPTKASDVRITNLRPLDRVTAGGFTLRGSAPPGDFVQIYIGATYLGRAEVDLAGRWSFKPKISGGGRRTFSIVDEVTMRQFGPFSLVIAPRPGMMPKGTVKAKAKAKAPVAPIAAGARLSAPSASAAWRRPVRRPRAAIKAKPVTKTAVAPRNLVATKGKLTKLTPPKVARPKAGLAVRRTGTLAKPKAKRTAALGVYAPLD